MLNNFREDLEQLLYDYAKVGVKLNSVDYEIVDTLYFDKEEAKTKSFKDIENLVFNIDVISES